MKKSNFAALLFTAAPLAAHEAGTHAPEVHCDGQEANLATYLEMSRVLFNERQGERVGEFYHEGFISHNNDAGGGSASQVPLSVMTQMWSNYKAIDPDREVIDNVIICQGPFVIAQVTTRGNYLGEGLVGDPENGRRYSTSAIDIYRFKDGKVAERWGNNDMVAKAKQLGMTLDLSFTPLPDVDGED